MTDRKRTVLPPDLQERQLLRIIAKECGYKSVQTMLEDTIVDVIAPGICLACRAVECEVEGDQDQGYCEACGENRVVSALILADLI